MAITAKTKNDCDDGYRDDGGGDQAVFNRRGSRLWSFAKRKTRARIELAPSQHHVVHSTYNHCSLTARKRKSAEFCFIFQTEALPRSSCLKLFLPVIGPDLKRQADIFTSSSSAGFRNT
jgi:hypothetical protein